MRPSNGERGDVDLDLITSALLRILGVEERIEEKLDAVLATIPSSEERTPFQRVDTRALQSETEPCNEAEQGVESDELIDGQSRNRSGERRHASKDSDGAILGGLLGATPSMPSTNTPILKSASEMRSCFQFLIDAQAGKGEHRTESLYGVAWTCVTKQSQDYSVVTTRRRFFDYIPISPNSMFSICWSFLTVAVLAAQLLYVPFDLAWNVELGDIPLGLAVFWSLDTCLGFLSCTYSADGEKNPIRVSAKAYAKSSFPLDMILVLSDWISVFDWGGSEFVKLLRFSKIARMLRLVTVLRMSKISRSVDRILDTAPLATGFRMILRVAYLCVSIIWFLHLTACSWFLIGNIGLTDTGERWLNIPTLMADGTPLDLPRRTSSIQYILCFHWSVATFTLGNMEIGYANIFERVFGILVTIISFVFGSVVISLLSTIFVEHQAAYAENRVKRRTLDRFLLENDVSNTLCLRIQKVCMDRLKMEQRLTFRDTIALETLPSSLYKELRYEIIGRFLAKHDLFNCWSTVNIRVAEEYSIDGVEMKFSKPGDDLFQVNTDSNHSYFFGSGKLNYSKWDMGPNSNGTLVPQGTWLCEAALWSVWRHVGTCEAQSRCKIAVASYKRLAHHVRSNPLILSITLSYCQLFCKAIALAVPPISEFPDDLCVPSTKFAELLMHFPNDLRVKISKQALEVSKPGKKYADRLDKEVNEGKCALYVNINGELERTVAVTVLVLNNDEGNVLYQVGKPVPISFLNENGEEGHHWEFEPDLKLPGLKQDQGERIEEALKRLVDTKLTMLNEKFEHIGTQLEEDTLFSREFGLETRYFRTKINCSMREEFPAKVVSSGSNICFQQRHFSPIELPSSGRLASGSKRRLSARLMHSLPLSAIPLYVVFEGTMPFIYAWLSKDIGDTLIGSPPHQRDEMLSQMLNNIDYDIIEQGTQEASSLLYRLDSYPM